MQKLLISLLPWKKMGMTLSIILKLQWTIMEITNSLWAEVHWNVFLQMFSVRHLILIWSMTKNLVTIRRKRLLTRLWIIWKWHVLESVKIMLKIWHIKSPWCAMQCLKTAIRNILLPRSQAMSLRSLLLTWVRIHQSFRVWKSLTIRSVNTMMLNILHRLSATLEKFLPKSTRVYLRITTTIL